MSKNQRASTPPEVFASRTRSISQMEDRDRGQDEEVRKIVERSSSKIRMEHASNSDLEKGSNGSGRGGLSTNNNSMSLGRSASVRVPGSLPPSPFHHHTFIMDVLLDLPHKSKSTRGRKPSSNEPVSKKQVNQLSTDEFEEKAESVPTHTLKKKAQNRNAQKTFRERREQFITNLQSKAEELAACLVEEKRRSAMLQARLNSISAQAGDQPKCAFCGVDRASNQVLSAQIRTMELQTVALKMENDSLKMRLQMIGDTAAGLDPLLTFQETVSTSMGIANTTPPVLDWPASLIDTPPFPTTQQTSLTSSPDLLIPLLPQENAEIMQNMNMDFNSFLANVIPNATPVNAISTTNSSPSALNTSNDEWLDVLTNCSVQSRFLLKSTTEMFGPAQTEFARSILKSIPSLSNCSHVDILVNLFQGMTRMKEKRKIEATLARVVCRWYDVLDACSTLSVSTLVSD
ncbi:hypothetical protein HDU81_003052 [Chytriomyces hyalinus]|nr:hypothetical protein HDU81_003052 [Chytriomyces hyalinus]